jgi:hypothetical protein
MQPLKQLSETLRSLADREHCVFAASDLAAAIRDTVEKEPWWSYLTQVIEEQAAKALKAIS